MSSIKDKVADAAHAVADTAKDVAHKVADGASQAADFVKDKVGMGDACGTAKARTDIQPHMDVIASCGKKVGVVDHLDGGAIKLTRKDSPDGQHHFIPTAWVDHVDAHVHLSKNSMETEQGWKADAASAAA